MDEVEQKVNSFKQYSDEVKKVSVLWQQNKIDDTLANEFFFFIQVHIGYTRYLIRNFLNDYS